jgi:hypothetical protein
LFILLPLAKVIIPASVAALSWVKYLPKTDLLRKRDWPAFPSDALSGGAFSACSPRFFGPAMISLVSGSRFISFRFPVPKPETQNPFDLYAGIADMPRLPPSTLCTGCQ